MEKLIKITITLLDGSKTKVRTTGFEVKPSHSVGFYVILNNGDMFACSNIQVEQKEVQPAFCL